MERSCNGLQPQTNKNAFSSHFKCLDVIDNASLVQKSAIGKAINLLIKKN